MKKHLLKSLLAVALLLVCGSVWAQDPVYTLSFTKMVAGTNYNSYTGAHETECGNVTWAVFGNQSMGDFLRVGGKNTKATDRTFTSAAAVSSSAIAKVVINHSGTGNGKSSEITVNSITVEGSISSDFTKNPKSKTISSPSVSSEGSLEFVLDEGNWDANSFFKITLNYQITGSNNCYMLVNTVDFFAAGPVTAVATPTFTPNGGNFVESQQVSIACATEGASISYTTDGTNWKAYSAPFTLTETTTVKAKATKTGLDDSNEATATFTKATAMTTMDAIFEASATNGNYLVTLNNWVVSGVKGSNAYVTDGTKGFIVYKSGHGFEVGDILSGTVELALTRYNGAAETTDLSSTTQGLTVTKGGSVTPQKVGIADMSGVNTGAVIVLENVTYNGSVFTDGTNTIKPYNTFMTPSFVNGQKYNITGVYVQYNDTKEIAPRSAADIEEIAATKYTISVVTPEHGKINANATEAIEGATVKLTVKPDAGYRLSSLTVKDAGNNSVTVTDNTFIMPASNVTVTATFEVKPKYTVTYMSLGEEVDSEEVYEGDAVANVPAVIIPEGWTFRGWTSVDNFETGSVAPEQYDISSNVAEDLTLYAVFAKAEGEAKTATLTNEEITDKDKGLSGSYGNFSIENSYGTWSGNACKQGNLSGDGEYFMQIRSNATVSYLKLPEFDGSISSVVLNKVCNTSKAQYTGDLYFRIAADNDAMAIVTGTSSETLDDVTLDIPAGYTTGYIMSSAACRIYSVTVNYVDGEVTYTTTAPAKTSYTVNIGATGYATFYSDDYTIVPEGVTVYGAENYDKTTQTLSMFTYEPLEMLNHNEGVVIKGTPNTSVEFEVAPEDYTNYNDEHHSWQLTGVVKETPYSVFAEDYTLDEWTAIYVFNVVDGVPGFYKLSSTGKLGANKVYMVINNAPSAIGMRFGGTTMVEQLLKENENVEIYDLLGRRVKNATKGIYIINGKKALVK